MLEVTALRKSYGNLVAVDGVSPRAGKGETIGLLGPNGAGKTSTVSMTAGLLRPDSGEVLIDGRALSGDTDPAKRNIGLVPQDLGLYDEMSARENLHLFGALYGLDGAHRKHTSAAMTSMLVLMILFAFARVVFGVRIQGSMLGFLAVCAAFSLMTASFGLMIAALGKTPEATRGLSIVVTTADGDAGRRVGSDVRIPAVDAKADRGDPHALGHGWPGRGHMARPRLLRRRRSHRAAFRLRAPVRIAGRQPVPLGRRRLR